MRKLLMSSIVLFLFSSSILILQIACDEDVMATPSTPSGEQKVVFTVQKSTFETGRLYDGEIWTMNIDGTNRERIADAFTELDADVFTGIDTYFVEE